MNRNWLHVKIALFVLVGSATIFSVPSIAKGKEGKGGKHSEAKQEKLRQRDEAIKDPMYRRLRDELAKAGDKVEFMTHQPGVKSPTAPGEGAEDAKSKGLLIRSVETKKLKNLMLLASEYTSSLQACIDGEESDDAASALKTLINMCIHSNISNAMMKDVLAHEGEGEKKKLKNPLELLDVSDTTWLSRDEKDFKHIGVAAMSACLYEIDRVMQTRAKKQSEAKEEISKADKKLMNNMNKVFGALGASKELGEKASDSPVKAQLKKLADEAIKEMESQEKVCEASAGKPSKTEDTEPSLANEDDSPDESTDEDATTDGEKPGKGKKDSKRPDDVNNAVGDGGYRTGKPGDPGSAPKPIASTPPLTPANPFQPGINGPGAQIDPGALAQNGQGGLDQLLPALLSALGNQQPFIEPQANRSATGGSKTENPPQQAQIPQIPPITPPQSSGNEQPQLAQQQPPQNPFDPSMFAQPQQNQGNDLQQAMLAQMLKDLNKEREPKATPVASTSEADRAALAERDAKLANLQFQNQMLLAQMQGGYGQQGQLQGGANGLNGARLLNGGTASRPGAFTATQSRRGYNTRVTSRSRTQTFQGTGGSDILQRSSSAGNVRGRISSQSGQ